MAKETNRLEALTQQNELLKEQNALLRERLELMQRSRPTAEVLPAEEERDIFIENINHDEIRSSYLVTNHQKRLWNVEIGLIQEFARICKKHNIRWYAVGGTLLGAARHKGFIPWDDDVDVAMFRPDFEKFKVIAAAEVKPPYSLDIWHNYRLGGDDFSDQVDNSLPLIPNDRVTKLPFAYPLFPLIKIRDSRTMMLEFPQFRHLNQGVWIDVFPIDSMPPFATKEQSMNFEISKTLFMSTTHPEIIRDQIWQGKKFTVGNDFLKKFIKLPFQKRGMYFDEFMAKNFSESENMTGDFRCIFTGHAFWYKRSSLADVTYLPFEKIQIPAPIDYDNVLTGNYGDWRKPVFIIPHAKMYSADVSYSDYFKNNGITLSEK